MRFGRLSVYMLTIIIGLGLFFGGIQLYTAERSREVLSDEAIKERARELGMVELKEVFQKTPAEKSE